jgi:tetratricopeptide (TPR) repeat protein/tRNA A-37 threonylcarbamoyl transferase component Bud32
MTPESQNDAQPLPTSGDAGSTPMLALQLARQAMDLHADELHEWLDRHCGGDAALRQRVLALVTSAWAVTELPPEDGEDAPTSVQAGTRLGSFQLVEPIGRGGMGEVWLGERRDGGFEQQVAIKLVLTGMAGSSERFQRERQILARLNHPHIAHLIDGGVTGAGQPWLAMEHVDGESIIDWCDHRRLDINERVRLMLPICAAVQFAHQALVVHRDIKPANILVDHSGRPKLLDFGIAKLLDGTDAAQTQTLIMTPAYAAPEQRSGEPVTTATDVYQLGAVLFELVTGRSVRSARVSRSGYAIGVKSGPVQPADGGREGGNSERMPPQRLQAILRSDVGRIIGKAMAEDPHERYGSARELADDLDNWLRDRPVKARRIDAAYRLRKFLRRNRLAVLVSGVLAASLLVALTVAWQRAQAEQQQQARTEKALRFMRELFSASKPESTGGGELTVAELLEGAASRIDSQFADDPESRGILLTELGDVYAALGKYDMAIPILESARAAHALMRSSQPMGYLGSTYSLANALHEVYRTDESIALADEGLALIEAAQPPDIDSWRESLTDTKATALSVAGRLEEAEVLYRQLLEWRASKATTEARDALLYNAFGHLLLQAGRGGEALEQFKAADRTLEQAGDASRWNRLVVGTSLALAHHVVGESRIALSRYERWLPEMEQYLGEGHNRTTIVRSQMAQVLNGLGQYRRALALVEKNLEIMAVPGAASEMDRVLVGSGVRPRLLLANLRLQEALPLAREGLAYLDEHVPDDFWIERGTIRSVIGDVLMRLGRYDEADVELELAYTELRRGRSMPVEQIDVGMEDALGRLALLQGDLDTAAQRFRAAIETSETRHGDDHPRTLRVRVHALWLQMRRQPIRAQIEELAALRQQLSERLSSEDAPQLWQIDTLLDEHARTLGITLDDATRVQRSFDALRRESGLQELPPFGGLSSF